VKRTQERGPRAANEPATDAGIREASYADHAALRDFLTHLSAQSRYLRFFTGAPLTSPAMLRTLAGDGPGVDAVVAFRGGVIIGHAMAAYDTGPGGTLVADVGVVVADEWQGRGVGSRLIRTLVARARARGATTLVMDVLAENQKMLAMIAGWWPGAGHTRNAAQITVRIQLAPQQGGMTHGRLTSAQRPGRGRQPDGHAGRRRHRPRKPAAVIPVG
jgi:GNAT superfamily N-acetyltransferase